MRAFDDRSAQLIGDRIIVPPPRDIRAVPQRLKEYECYDWWFCHKSLQK